LDEKLKIMKKDISCKKAKKLAGDYSQDLLSPDLIEGVERHLSSCPSCQKEYQDNRKVLTLLSRDRFPDPGPDFWNGLSSRVMAQVRLNRLDPVGAPWYKKVWGSPFGWPGYAWVTALILIFLTPAAIYTIHFRGYNQTAVQETLESELKWEMGLESYSAAVESLSARESIRLGERLTARLAKDLPRETEGLIEDDLQWDVSPALENLNAKELDALIKKTQPGGSAGFGKGMSYVS
jgi:Putative zinc-finger